MREEQNLWDILPGGPVNNRETRGAVSEPVEPPSRKSAPAKRQVGKDSVEEHIPEIGLVLFVKSSRARRLSISVKPFTGVRVAIPRRVSYKAAREFVLSKRLWVQKTRLEMREVERQQRAQAEVVAEIDLVQARRFLTARLTGLARQHGYRFNRVSLRNQKTRWGSCSAKNNISLNLQLVTLPEELCDYVLLHELVHTRIKNHSKAFWGELDALVGDARGLDKRLKDYKLGLT